MWTSKNKLHTNYNTGGTNEMTILSQNIKVIRLNLGLTMAEFASKIDAKAKSGTVSNWEHDRNKPNIHRIKRIAELGHTTVMKLLGGSI